LEAKLSSLRQWGEKAAASISTVSQCQELLCSIVNFTWFSISERCRGFDRQFQVRRLLIIIQFFTNNLNGKDRKAYLLQWRLMPLAVFPVPDVYKPAAYQRPSVWNNFDSEAPAMLLSPSAVYREPSVWNDFHRHMLPAMLLPPTVSVLMVKCLQIMLTVGVHFKRIGRVFNDI